MEFQIGSLESPAIAGGLATEDVKTSYSIGKGTISRLLDFRLEGKKKVASMTS
jgi:hypothetical protein